MIYQQPTFFKFKAVQQYSSTAVQQYSSTAVQQYSSTAVQQYSSTVVAYSYIGQRSQLDMEPDIV